jgi:hypothetical protein
MSQLDDAHPSEEPNLNTGTPWSSWEDEDIRWQIDHNRSTEEIAEFLCRTPSNKQRLPGSVSPASPSGASPQGLIALQGRQRLSGWFGAELGTPAHSGDRRGRRDRRSIVAPGRVDASRRRRNRSVSPSTC